MLYKLYERFVDLFTCVYAHSGSSKEHVGTASESAAQSNKKKGKKPVTKTSVATKKGSKAFALTLTATSNGTADDDALDEEYEVESIQAHQWVSGACTYTAHYTSME